MTSIFNFGSISAKLKLIIVGITISITIVAFSVLAYNQYHTNRTDLEQNLTVNAKLIADYAVTTIVFDDVKGAEDVLSKLDQIEYVVSANIYDSTGKFFAAYRNIAIQTSPKFKIINFVDSLYYENDYINIVQNISYDNNNYGYLFITATTSQLKHKLKNYIIFLIILLVILIVISYILANVLQKIISKPIKFLTQIAEEISQSNNYSLRVKPQGTNEIFSLYKEFNNMLDKINIHQTERDIANKNLQKLNSELDEIVKNKTNELRNALAILEAENIERKKAQETLSQVNEDLRISQQTMYDDALLLQELNNKLIESEEELKQLNEMKNKFFSIIAHDLKNPLTVILGSVDLLQIYYNKNNPEKIEFQIQRLKEGVLFFRSLLSNLLEWARAQSGSISFKPEKLSIPAMINYNIQSVKAMADSKKILLNYLEIENEIYVFADENMINTVIRNLLTNAIKFTNENGEISVNVYHEKNCVSIEVKDSGIGMSQEDVEKLFRIDVNASTIGKSKEKGTGLGLIICKDFVTKHKNDEHTGNLTVSSELNNGSTFKFTLPIG